MKTTVILLAAGQGKRMKCDTPKQYLLLHNKPVLFYSLHVLEESAIDEIVLVVGKGEIEYCQKEIIRKYHFHKISFVIEGGEERFDSVYKGLNVIKYTDYVLIHDAARPFLTEDIIKRVLETVEKTKACVVGMPVKDTIKIVDNQGIVESTPDRKKLWQIQTPQAFSYDLIKRAYDKLFEKKIEYITDDAMVVETMLAYPIQIVEGSYENIKITTTEDVTIAEALVES